MKKLLTVGLVALAAVGTLRAAEKPGFVRVVWSEAAGEQWTVEGLADREMKRPMATNTVFAICSNTKPVTSVLALTLVEEGKISLDDPVSKYFPAFTNITIKGRPPKRPILLRYLLTHLSGLTYAYREPDRKPNEVPYLEQVDYAVAKGLRREPGEGYQYCGLGFQIMGAIMEKVTGRTVPELMKERIFDPLGMTETTFYPDAAMLARAAIPYYYPPTGGAPVRYEFSERWALPLDDPKHTAGLAGGLFSTAPDYLKFSQMMARKGAGPDGRRILSEATFEKYLLTRQTPPGDSKDASFDVHFNKDHTSGSKGGLFATSATWNWAEKSCEVTFRAKSPSAPKGVVSQIDASGFDGKKTRFVVTDVKIVDGKATCTVSNNEDRNGYGTVYLFVNGKKLAAKRVGLAIGETQSVTFSPTLQAGAKVKVYVN